MNDAGRRWPVGVTVLTVLAVFYTLYFARAFLIPITFAVLLDFLLSPAVRALVRWHVPLPVAAALVLFAMLGTGSLFVYDLSGPVQSWADNAPETLATAQTRLRRLLKPLQRVTKTAEQVESAATGGVAGGGAAKPTEVVVRGPSIVSRLFGSTQRFLIGLLEVTFLLYFLLAAGDLFLQKLIKVLPNVHDRHKAIEIARATEASISTYLLTTLAVNAVEGGVVGAALWALGMPNPVLWGALVTLLEFIPYLGALSLVVLLTLGAFASFNDVGHALLIPAAFLAINLIQANLVSPMLLGHRLALNPVALLVSLAFWLWIWGIPGGLLAVPLLATLKIFCDHIERLAPVGEFLGRRDGELQPPILKSS